MGNKSNNIKINKNEIEKTTDQINSIDKYIYDFGIKNVQMVIRFIILKILYMI